MTENIIKYDIYILKERSIINTLVDGNMTFLKFSSHNNIKNTKWVEEFLGMMEFSCNSFPWMCCAVEKILLMLWDLWLVLPHKWVPLTSKTDKLPEVVLAGTQVPWICSLLLGRYRCHHWLVHEMDYEWLKLEIDKYIYIFKSKHYLNLTYHHLLLSSFEQQWDLYEWCCWMSTRAALKQIFLHIGVKYGGARGLEPPPPGKSGPPEKSIAKFFWGGL